MAKHIATREEQILTKELISRGVGSGWLARMMAAGEPPAPGQRDYMDWQIIQGALTAMRAAQS